MTKKFFLALSILIFISACGGGGGSSSSSSSSGSSGSGGSTRISSSWKFSTSRFRGVTMKDFFERY